MSTTRKTCVYTLLICLGLSLFLNLVAYFNWLNTPEDRIGTLTKDVQVIISPAGPKGNTITLPKGLTVRDASPRGFARISLLAPFRFSIYIADSEDDLVDYSREVKGDELYFTKRTTTGIL